MPLPNSLHSYKKSLEPHSFLIKRNRTVPNCSSALYFVPQTTEGTRMAKRAFSWAEKGVEKILEGGPFLMGPYLRRPSFNKITKKIILGKHNVNVTHGVQLGSSRVFRALYTQLSLGPGSAWWEHSGWTRPLAPLCGHCRGVLCSPPASAFIHYIPGEDSTMREGSKFSKSRLALLSILICTINQLCDLGQVTQALWGCFPNRKMGEGGDSVIKSQRSLCLHLPAWPGFFGLCLLASGLPLESLLQEVP